MSLRRKNLNITLLILCLILGGWAAWLYRRPPLVSAAETEEHVAKLPSRDTVYVVSVERPDAAVVADAAEIAAEAAEDTASVPAHAAVERELPTIRVETTGFRDAEPRTMAADHPFRKEALKILSGRLEETDSASRHKILSYCEHLRTSYTTRDIDFIRQVFSDNALIIVGHVVKSGERFDSTMTDNSKVRYSIRSKKAYIDKLSRIFASGKEIDVRFSDFRIMRHATVEGLYGVTLRQKYSCGAYSDDGYLFLLWDFRDRSMPLIHVRTWQPSLSISTGDDEIIEIGDFNLE